MVVPERPAARSLPDLEGASIFACLWGLIRERAIEGFPRRQGRLGEAGLAVHPLIGVEPLAPQQSQRNTIVARQLARAPKVIIPEVLHQLVQAGQQELAAVLEGELPWPVFAHLAIRHEVTLYFLCD